MIGFLAIVMAAAPLYLVRFNIFGLPTTLLEILIVAFLFATVLKFKIKDLRKIQNLGKINLAIALFILAGIISTFVSPNKLAALGILKAFIIEPVLMFYAIILTIKKSEQLSLIFKTTFWVAFLISLFGIFQHYSFIHLPIRFWGYGSEVLRITSIFEYPNALSLYLGPLLGFFTSLWINDYPLTKNKFASFFALLVMLIALIMTFSRGAWIAVALGLLIILIKRFGYVRTLIPTIILTIILIFIPSIEQRLTLGVSDASSSAHFDLLKEGAAKLLHNPIFGNGLLGFQNTSVLYPHNIILNFWLELGILGLLAFIWIVTLAFKQYQNRSDTIKWASVIYLLIVIIHGLVDVPYFKNDLALLFWFIIALFYI